MRSFRTYQEILLKRGIRYSFHEAWKKIQRFHFIRDNRILELQNEYSAYRHLRKYARVLKHNTLANKELPPLSILIRIKYGWHGCKGKNRLRHW